MVINKRSLRTLQRIVLSRVKIWLFLVPILLASVSYGQNYTFKVIVVKGTVKVKSSNAWTLLKTGAVMHETDEILIDDNSYLGLIHSSGKPLELRKAGRYAIRDCAGMMSDQPSLLSKYVTFVLSTENNAPRNRLSATGAVHRSTEKAALHLLLPEIGTLEFFGSDIILSWSDLKGVHPYAVILRNSFNDTLKTIETENNYTRLSTDEAYLKHEDVLIVEVMSTKDPVEISKRYMLRRVAPAEHERIATILRESEPNQPMSEALQKFILGCFFEGQGLFIDAMTAYMDAIDIDSSYRNAYNQFLDRQEMKVQ